MGFSDGKDLPQHTKNAIQDRAVKLQNNYKKLCDLGKKREKLESADILEKLMMDTIIFLSDCIHLRKILNVR